MKQRFDEEMLAAFALDELNALQAAAVADSLEADADARMAVDEYRQLAQMAKKTLQSTPQLELDELRRKRVLQQAQKPAARLGIRRTAALAAAAVLLIVGAMVLIPTRSTMYKQTGVMTESPALAGRQLESLLDAKEQEALSSLGYLAADTPAGGMGGMAPSAPQPDRYLVKTAFVSIETEDARKAAAGFTAQAVALGGFVGNLNEQTDGLGRHTVMLEVRVPADKLDGALNALDAFGKVLNKKVNAQDVTEEYVDNESRIRNLTKTEERLLDHLGKTSMIENTLKIESELNRVREQLELIQGRQRVLSHRVAFSSIRANFTEAPKAESIAPVDTFSIGRVATDAVRSLLEFGRVLLTKLIWISVWLPVWAPFLLVGWLVLRRLLRA